jgi:type II secretory pathway pseudopilin PulG
MADDQRCLGFSLLEMMIMVLILQVLLSIAWPGIQGILTHYRCQHAALSLEKELQRTQMKAILSSRSQIFNPPELGFKLSWHGFVSGRPLVFETNPVSNRVNGFFELQCSLHSGYRLWINRLGHFRLASIVV